MTLKVEIYGRSKPECPMCTMAKATYDAASVPYTYYDMAAGEWSIESLMEKLGVPPRTLPVLFVNGEHVSKGISGLKDAIADAEAVSLPVSDLLGDGVL